MKKTLYINRMALVLVLLVLSCKQDFLEREPAGVLTPDQITTRKGVQELLIGTYAVLDGNYAGGDSWRSSVTNWVYGSIVGGEANKGSNAGDQTNINPIQRYEPQAVNDYFNEKWIALYDGVARANTTLRVLTQVTDASEAEKKQIAAEARFLRGFYHFEAKKMWSNIPFVDESIEYVKNNFKVPNTATDVWTKIEADMQFAYDNLPEKGMEIGRVNKWAAAAFLAKVYMFQSKFDKAKPLFDDIITKGVAQDGEKYALAPQFHYNFNVEYENGKGYEGTESVFAVQASINDGGGAQNSNAGEVLNFPYNGGPAGCCGFFQPSFELVNSYRTSANGLPLLDGSYNLPANEVKNDQGLSEKDPFTPDTRNLDPRLDWTAGRRGVPYLDWGNHPGASWIRDQGSAGPYAPKKNAFYKAQQSKFSDGSSWTSGYTALNYVLIRYADVLLMAAECEVEIGSLETARQYVNQVRSRAANPEGFVSGGGNYVISEYPAGGAPFSSKESARQAVRFERKLELALEGHRFFDLVRWGEAEKTLNAYLAYESTKLPSTFGGAKFTAPKNNYFPIPQRQIDLTGAGVMKQNAGYQ